MSVLPTTTFQQPGDEWFKSVNGGTLPHHSVVANPTPIPTYSNSSVGNVSLNYDTVKKFNLKELEYAIRGEMVTVEMVMSDLDYLEKESKLQMQLADVIKQELVHKLAERLMQSKSILFTAQTNNVTMGKTFRASIFATSDSNVRILKEFQKRNT